MKIVFLSLISFFSLSAVAPKIDFKVSAHLETDPVSSSGDAADDTTVWIHPTSSDQSLIVGTNKQKGLVLYDLHGKKKAEYSVGRINNIDSRPNFIGETKTYHLLAGSNVGSRTFDLYTIDESNFELKKVASQKISSQPYGICVGFLPSQGHNILNIFITSKDGSIDHWQVSENDGYQFKQVQRFRVKSTVEGCVLDDETGDLFVGEENVGLWRFQLLNGNKANLVDRIKPQGGNLAAEVEGVAIYNHLGKEKLLVVSSQGDNTYHLYDMKSFAHLGRFAITNNSLIDGTSDTDGIDIVSIPLSDRFPDGIFIAQDGTNESSTGQRENQNFKLVRWSDIESKLLRP